MYLTGKSQQRWRKISPHPRVPTSVNNQIDGLDYYCILKKLQEGMIQGNRKKVERYIFLG
jgi:hypothetical protein